MELEPGDGTVSDNDRLEFQQKVTLLLIDRLLIGILLVFLGLFIDLTLEQERAAIEERERVRDVTMAFSQVLTEVVATYRETVFTAVRDLLALLNEYERSGQVDNLDDRHRLRTIVEDIENAMDQLGRANPRLSLVGDPFIRRVREIRSDLINRRRNPQDFRRDAEDLLESYTVLLGELRTTGVLAMEADRRAVNEILSSQRVPSDRPQPVGVNRGPVP